MKNIYKYLLLFVATALIVSCNEEDLEPTLAQDKDLATGINTAADLASVLNSAYDRMTGSGHYGRNTIIMGDVRTDNAYSTMNSGRFAASNMDHTAQGYGPWGTIYGVIAITNIVIGVDGSSLTGSQTAISHTQGQAYALRALAHFDLLRMYGQHFITGQGGGGSLGVPYVKTYKNPDNLTPARDTVGSNVGDITADITTAISMMSASLDSSAAYMTVAGAYAIGARALLYAGSVNSSLYATAGTMAKWVIDNSGKTPVSAAGFNASYSTDYASNAIFELSFTGTDNRGINGVAYILRGTSYGDVRILTRDRTKAMTSPDLLDIAEVGDVRFAANMIGLAQAQQTVLGKYPTMNGSDNLTLFRIEEMHLIYAEAMLRGGDAATAKTYLNNIPALRGLGADFYASATLDNILLERRKEFYFEGMRYDDLLRTGKGMPLVDPFKQMNDDKTGSPPGFGDYNTAYPIGTGELNANPNMVENYGY